MAHFAKVENGVVEDVIVVDNDDIDNLEFPESEPVGRDHISSIGLEGEWFQTSYNHNFRKQYAGIGFSYNSDADVFVGIKPDGDGWYLNENYDWANDDLPNGGIPEDISGVVE
jgi:hypothetical protein